MDNLSLEQKMILIEQLQSRLDNHLHFYIRLDKDRILCNEYLLTDYGNCFHIKISIAAYPHKREIAEEIVKKIISL